MSIHKKSQIIARKKLKLEDLEKELKEVGTIKQIHSTIEENIDKKVIFRFTKHAGLKRRRKPSCPDSLERQKKVRRLEMFCVSKAIHGAKKAT